MDENSVSEDPNLKIFCARVPPPPYKPRAFGARDNAPPVQKSLATALYSTDCLIYLEKATLVFQKIFDQRHLSKIRKRPFIAPPPLSGTVWLH